MKIALKIFIITYIIGEPSPTTAQTTYNDSERMFESSQTNISNFPLEDYSITLKQIEVNMHISSYHLKISVSEIPDANP